MVVVTESAVVRLDCKWLGDVGADDRKGACLNVVPKPGRETYPDPLAQRERERKLRASAALSKKVVREFGPWSSDAEDMIDHLQACRQLPAGSVSVHQVQVARSVSSWPWSHRSSLARTLPAFGCQGPQLHRGAWT